MTMRERRGARASRRQRAIALVLLGLGTLLLTAGVASASSLAGAVATVTFWNNDNVVTLDIPTMCPATNPQCVWKLQVNEPDIPAQTVVGVATGTSGVLTVPYPANFCGVIQADVFVGPTPWRLIVGHQEAIQTAAACCPSSTAAAVSPTTQPAPITQSVRSTPRRGRLGHPAAYGAHQARFGRATTGTTATTESTTTTTLTPTVAQNVTCGPITGAVNTVPADAPTQSQLPFTGAVNTVPASTSTATLPFTGIDLQPLLIAGSTLIMLGLAIGTTHQQRLRALARTGYAIRISRTYSVRTARWFLGE